MCELCTRFYFAYLLIRYSGRRSKMLERFLVYSKCSQALVIMIYDGLTIRGDITD